MATYQRTYSRPGYWQSRQPVEEGNSWERPMANLADALIGGMTQRWRQAAEEEKAVETAQILAQALQSGDYSSIANNPRTAAAYPAIFEVGMKNKYALDLKRQQDASGAQADLLTKGLLPKGGGYLDMSNPELSFERAPGMAESIAEAGRIENFGKQSGTKQADLMYNPMIQRAVKTVDLEMDPKIAGATVDARTAAELRGKLNEVRNTEIPYLAGRNKAIETLSNALFENADRLGMQVPGMPSAQPRGPIGVGAPEQEMPYETKWDGNAAAPKQPVAAQPSFAPNPAAGGSILNQVDRLKNKRQYEDQYREAIEKDKSTENFATAQTYVKQMVESLDSEEPAAMLNFLYGVAKVMDPPSVVRNEEVKMAQQFAGIEGEINRLILKVKGGGRLLDSEKMGLTNAAGRVYNEHLANYRGKVDYYGGLADKEGLDRGRVIVPRDLRSTEEFFADFEKRRAKPQGVAPTFGATPRTSPVPPGGTPPGGGTPLFGTLSPEQEAQKRQRQAELEQRIAERLNNGGRM